MDRGYVWVRTHGVTRENAEPEALLPQPGEKGKVELPAHQTYDL